MNAETKEKPDSSLRLAIISTIVIVVVFGAIIGGFYVYRRLPERLGPVKGNFIENFDDGKIDEKLVILTNGSTKYSVEKGKLFFDQGSSSRDAHMWYYSEPLDLTRPFVARVRTKTANYVAGTLQGCHSLIIWATPDKTFELYGGGACHANLVTCISLCGGEGGVHGGRTMFCIFSNTGAGINWNFTSKSWSDGASSPPMDKFTPYPAETFIKIELWSTPSSYYYRVLGQNGALLCQTKPLKWADQPKVAAGEEIYLCGGEEYTSWWTNDEWVDLIQVKYEY
ncbi:MAG: hypothetical protein E3J72_01960 [Planctomycetota bacterium]|nr:MAG: hypothetical protein E3J72_01960 [Planctomycetota bacterium]